MDKIPVSVIILTRDEEINIADCLNSLAAMEDVIIVDSGSTDKTLNIAQKVKPDARIFHHEFRDFGEQRNWALDKTDPRHEWILFLDADERCTGALSEEIARVTQGNGEATGYFLTYRNYLMGRWIRRSTLYPSWQLRLLKKGFVRYQKEGHGQKELASGSVGYISSPYEHYGFAKGTGDWLRKHRKYSADEIQLINRMREEPLKISELFKGSPVEKRRCLKRLAARCVWGRALISFPYRFLWRGGVLDGIPGLVYCLLWTWVELQIAYRYSAAAHTKQ